MKAHHILGKLADHHARLAKMHKSHADGLDDGDAHASFHHAAAEEHSGVARELRRAADAVAADLPDAEELFAGNFKNPSSKATRWERGDIVDNVAGAIPDNADWKKSLEDRGLQRVPRFGAPTESEAISRLAPELRKLVGGE